jgi:RNA polymerase-binding transcription factor DksA
VIISREHEIRARLERRLSQLLARTGQIESDLRQPADRDWTERATERENEEVLERLGAAELAEIGEIRAALARLDAGSYGRCQRCGAEIQQERLAALPFAPTCIACAEATAGSAR